MGSVKAQVDFSWLSWLLSTFVKCSWGQWVGLLQVSDCGSLAPVCALNFSCKHLASHPKRDQRGKREDCLPGWWIKKDSVKWLTRARSVYLTKCWGKKPLGKVTVSTCRTPLLMENKACGPVIPVNMCSLCARYWAEGFQCISPLIPKTTLWERFYYHLHLYRNVNFTLRGCFGDLLLHNEFPQHLKRQTFVISHFLPVRN